MPTSSTSPGRTERWPSSAWRRSGTELGAGCMWPCAEIRGAGNILGAERAGHRLGRCRSMPLTQAVRLAAGNLRWSRVSRWTTGPALLPEDYISDTELRAEHVWHIASVGRLRVDNSKLELQVASVHIGRGIICWLDSIAHPRGGARIRFDRRTERLLDCGIDTLTSTSSDSARAWFCRALTPIRASGHRTGDPVAAGARSRPDRAGSPARWRWRIFFTEGMWRWTVST